MLNGKLEMKPNVHRIIYEFRLPKAPSRYKFREREREREGEQSIRYYASFYIRCIWVSKSTSPKHAHPSIITDGKRLRLVMYFIYFTLLLGGLCIYWLCWAIFENPLEIVKLDVRASHRKQLIGVHNKNKKKRQFASSVILHTLKKSEISFKI